MSDEKPVRGLRPALITVIIILLMIISFLSLWVRDLAIQLSEAADEVAALEQEARDAEDDPDPESSTDDVVAEDISEATEDASGDATGVTETEIGVVSRLFQEGGKDKIEIDYIQMLIGNEGAQARIDDGDCTGTLEDCRPDNDYYIRNENPKLRIFPLAKDVSILREDNTVPPVAGKLARSPVGLVEFREYFENGFPNEGDPSLREPWADRMYEVNIVSGEVKEIVWLFFP